MKVIKTVLLTLLALGLLGLLLMGGVVTLLVI